MTQQVCPAPRGVKREAVFQGKQRIPGLWVRETKSGPVFEVQKRVDGRMRRIKLRAANKTDAINEARTLTVDVQRGDVQLGDRTLTVTALRDSYLDRERGVLGTRRARTVDLHEQQLRDHVIPLLGPRTKACDVTAVHLRRMIDTLTAHGLAGSSVRGCVSAASAMFKHGVRDLGTLPRNPVRDLDRGDRPSGKRRSEPRYLTVAQVESIFAEMTDVFRPVAATCFWAALRISEALALRWEDIDFKAGTVAVPGTKTAASRASVPLLPALARELQAHRARQAANGFEQVQPEASVFVTSSGPLTRQAERVAGVAGRSRTRGPQPVMAQNRLACTTSGTALRRTPSPCGSPTRRWLGSTPARQPAGNPHRHAGLREGEAEKLWRSARRRGVRPSEPGPACRVTTTGSCDAKTTRSARAAKPDPCFLAVP